MAEGTFTLVDDRIFLPRVDLHEDDKNNKSSNTNKFTHVNKSNHGEKSKTHSHRKVSRRKVSKKNPKMRKKEKKKSLFTKSNVKIETNFQNGFEFCTTVNDNIEIKEEICSETEIKSNSDSDDDDIPLASLDKHSSAKHELDEEEQDQIREYAIKFETLKEKEGKKTYKNEEFFCSKCNEYYKTKKLYYAHMREIHGKLYKCKLCLMSFDKKQDLEDHQNVHTGNRPYSCYVCENESFKTETALKSHMKKHKEGKQIKASKTFSCYICGKMLSTSSSLEEHIRLHTGEKPIVCTICDKSFARLNDLRHHQNVHEELWKCKHCQKCFPTPFKLKEHVRSHTGELPYECDKCDRKFARVSDFRYHVGTHLGIKPYSCGECGMSFTTSSSVTRHRLNMHQSGPKQYECPVCSKKFNVKERLTTHIKRHENNKKFKCELCPAARSTIAELNKHMVIHGGQFRCDTCHRGFQNAQRLAVHTARHDIAGKPYACFVCSIGYHSSQGLNKHLATVHRNEDIPQIAPQHLCTLCGQVFELKDKLNRHLKENHIVIVVGEIHSLDDNNDRKMDIVQQHIKVPHDAAEIPDIEKKVQVENKPIIDECMKDPVSDKVPNSSENSDSEKDIPHTQSSKNLEMEVAVTQDNDTNSTSEASLPKEICSSTSQPEINHSSEESPVVTTESAVENSEKTKLTTSILNVPTFNHSIDNTKSANINDISSPPLANSNSEIERNLSVPNHKMYNQASFMRTLSSALPVDTNIPSPVNYRPPIENHVQSQMNHVNNPWFLPKADTSMSHAQSLPRSFYESRQRYELRMPKFNPLSMHQFSDYRNTNSERISFPDYRNDAPMHTPIRNREPSNTQKYFYETENLRNFKEYCVDASQKDISDDRRKYNQQLPQFSADLSAKQNIHNYSNHLIPPRDYSTLSAHNLSNSTNANIQNLHYPNHAFSSSPDFFHNFRDLQHKILKTQEYEHSRHASPPVIMDMSNHRLNPTSPMSPYNQANSHILENMSPMSRNSYEDSSNSQIHGSLMYGNHSRKHDMTPNGTETNSNNNQIDNNSKHDRS